MGAASEVVVEVETSTDVWEDISADVLGTHDFFIRYGIRGNKPKNTAPSSGECGFSVHNSAGNASNLQGRYSFMHANVLSGWAFGKRIRVACYRTSDTAAAVTSITRSGNTATVTTTASHGLVTNDWATIAGAVETDYNGRWRITKTGASTFTFTVPNTPSTPATGTITFRVTYIKHNGKLSSCTPGAGKSNQFADVISYDGIRQIAEKKLNEVGIQITKREDELVTAVLDALPSDAQPLYRDLDTGVDSYPYAFDELGDGVSALGVLKDVAISAYALIFMKGDGTLAFRNRNARATATSAFTFNNDMHELNAPADIAQLYNHVVTTINPRDVDDVATTVIYSTVGTPLSVEPGATLSFKIEFRDPDETRTLIGATAVVDPPVTPTDWLGNSQVDGLGSDFSSDLTVTMTPYASTAILSVENTGSSTVYLVNGSGVAFLQVRAKGVYSLGPQGYEATSSQAYGSRDITLDLKYQDSPSVAQDYANYILNKFDDIASQISFIEFHGNDSDNFLQQALAREPGDIITLSETVIGASAVDVVIHSIELNFSKGSWITCRFGVAPSAPFDTWILDTSELGVNTTLGF